MKIKAAAKGDNGVFGQIWLHQLFSADDARTADLGPDYWPDYWPEYGLI